MRTMLKALAVVAALGAAPALADPLTPDKFPEALSHYDADTIAAATTYAKTFDVHTQMERSAQYLTARLTAEIKAKNPDMTDEQVKLYVDTYKKIALVDAEPAIEQATVLTALEVFSKDELTALNQFYSSPVGAGVLKKFPVMMGKLPQMMHAMQGYFLPKALEGARAALKAQGVEVKS